MHPAKDQLEYSDDACLCKTPKVSVIMMAYNHAEFLPQAVEGVLTQRTTFPVELLIGEDHSTDNTREVALQLQRAHPDRIRVITSNTNVGMHDNFARLFAATRGRFVAICEGDDYWIAPDKLQRQAEVLEARPDVTGVFTDFAICDMQRGHWVVDFNETAFHDVDINSLRGELHGRALAGRLRTLTAMYRSTVLAALYARGIPMKEYPFIDGFLLSEAIAGGKIECLPLVGAVYRRSPNSATRSSAASNLRVIQRVRDFYATHATYFPESGAVADDVLHALDISICRAAYVAEDAAAFEQAYARVQRGRVPLTLRFAESLVRSPNLRRLSIRTRSLARRAMRRSTSFFLSEEG